MAKFIGYHDDKDIPIKRGDTVTINKGVMVRSTHPRFQSKTCGRTYKVKVDHVLNGMDRNGQPVWNPSVRWPGSGGYWHQVDINDIPEICNGKDR